MRPHSERLRVRIPTGPSFMKTVDMERTEVFLCKLYGGQNGHSIERCSDRLRELCTIVDIATGEQAPPFTGLVTYLFEAASCALERRGFVPAHYPHTIHALVCSMLEKTVDAAACRAGETIGTIEFHYDSRDVDDCADKFRI